MGADADQNEPLRVLNPFGIGLRVGQDVQVDRVGLRDFFRSSMTDKQGFSTPGEGFRLSFRDGREIDFQRRFRLSIRRRIHLIDQRPQSVPETDGSNRTRGQVQKIAS